MEVAKQNDLSSDQLIKIIRDIANVKDRKINDTNVHVTASTDNKAVESKLLETDGKPPSYVNIFIDNKAKPKDEASKIKLFQQAAQWSVNALSSAAESPNVKRYNRLLLGCSYFVGNMEWAGVYDKTFRSGIETKLKILGKPLRQLFDTEVW